MQQRVSGGIRRAPPRTTAQTSVKAPPPITKRKVSKAAKLFYLMRWTYHFVTPIGMVLILWGVYEAYVGDYREGLSIIAGGAAFTYLANYFNKAR